MRRRVFVAVTLPRSARDEVAAWQARYRQLPVRWISGENLHVTLVPPWYTDDAKAVRETLGMVVGRRFTLNFRNVSYGPDSRAPRLIWAEGETPPELPNLKAAVERYADRDHDARPYAMHMTLARFRPEEFSSFPVKVIADRVQWSFPAETFALMESHLAPEGAEYRVLEEFKLV